MFHGDVATEYSQEMLFRKKREKIQITARMPHQFLENISHFHKFCDWPDYEIMVLPIGLHKNFEHKNVNIILSISP